MAYEIQVTPDLNYVDTAIGIKLPMIGRNGVLFDVSYSTVDQALSNFKNLILTRRGERIMQPLFGTDIYNSIFELDHDDLTEHLKYEIIEATGFWLPYIQVRSCDVKATTSDVGYGFNISTQIAVDNYIVPTPITFTITSNGISTT